ncbi:hypothetical protein [Halolamina pelagica]|uniref:hypothetical protein n=1 Tax=Halolamina pelagica TaxID=699431 RepID=UPI0011873EB0|nr:hypothetical protein [Halolamina pelagica]
MLPGIVPDLLLGLLALAAFDAVALLPVLLSTAVRRLGRQWPTGSLGVNYLVAAAAFGITHYAAIMAAVALHGGASSRTCSSGSPASRSGTRCCGGSPPR